MKTPITAEEFLKDDEFVNVKGFIKESGTLKTTTSLMEQYATELLTKEKEQREELIKEVCIESFLRGQISESSQDIISKQKAEQYYNEVIKPKYKVK